MISDCKLIELPKIIDRRGNLSFVEENNHVPFKIKRIFYLYDVAKGESRGGHAHKQAQQFILPLSGEFEIEVDDGINKSIYKLYKRNIGLYIPTMIWCNLTNFTEDAVCLVLTSELYDEADYHRKYMQFLAARSECVISECYIS